MGRKPRSLGDWSCYEWFICWTLWVHRKFKEVLLLACHSLCPTTCCEVRDAGLSSLLGRWGNGGSSSTIPSQQASICASRSPVFPSSSTASFPRLQEKKVEAARALPTDPQPRAPCREAGEAPASGARGGHPGPRRLLQGSELNPTPPVVPSPFLLIVVALRASGGKCHPAGLDFSAHKGSRECFVSSFGWPFWVSARNRQRPFALIKGSCILPAVPRRRWKGQPGGSGKGGRGKAELHCRAKMVLFSLPSADWAFLL